MRKKSRMTKMTALFLAGVTAATTVMAGCGSDTGSESQGQQTSEQSEESSGEKVKVRMVTYMGNPERDALIQEMVEDLDNIELEIISPPSDQAHQKIESMLQAGEGIDIVELDSVTVQYIQNGLIDSLDSYISEWDEWDTVSEVLKEQLTSYDGSVYSIPYGIYERALFYRKDWFEEKNLEVPETWDELYEAAVALTDPSQNRYGYAFRGGSGTFGFLQMTALSFMDPDIIDISTPFITTEGKSIYEYQEAVDAMEFYKKLYEDASNPDSVAWGYSEMVEAFYSGTAAMLIQDPEVVTTCEEYMEEGTWDVAPLPVGDSGRALFPAGFAGWGIASCSENKDAAWEVIKTISGVEGNTYFCKQNGNIPIHTTAQEDPYFSEGYYKCYMDMAAEPDKYVGYVDGGETRFATEEEVDLMTESSSMGEKEIQSMLLGDVSPQECVDTLAESWDWVHDSEWVQEKIAGNN